MRNNSAGKQCETHKGEALTCRASPLRKQSTGLFFDSPLAERLRYVSLFSISWEKRPEALPLDSGKGHSPLHPDLALLFDRTGSSFRV